MQQIVDSEATVPGLSPRQYTVCFQSRLGTEKWAQFYTSKSIEHRYEEGDRKPLVLCPASTADCFETVIEISDEHKEEFEELGGEVLDLVPSLNVSPKWVETVAQMIEARVGVAKAAGRRPGYETVGIQ